MDGWQGLGEDCGYVRERQWNKYVRVSVWDRECILTHILYPLLIIEDFFEPSQVLLFERHQDHECAGLVVQSRVIGGWLGIEEPHGGLVPHVLLVSSHRGIIQPEAGTWHYIQREAFSWLFYEVFPCLKSSWPLKQPHNWLMDHANFALPTSFVGILETGL